MDPKEQTVAVGVVSRSLVMSCFCGASLHVFYYRQRCQETKASVWGAHSARTTNFIFLAAFLIKINLGKCPDSKEVLSESRNCGANGVHRNLWLSFSLRVGLGLIRQRSFTRAPLRIYLQRRGLDRFLLMLTRCKLKKRRLRKPGL